MSTTTRMKKKTKIVVIAVPFFGHINPITGLIYELISSQQADVIFYGCEQVRKVIEKTGAEYRAYPYFPIERFRSKPNRRKQDSTVMETLAELMALSTRLVPDLVAMLERERPDLVIYDQWAVHTKYTLAIVEQRRRSRPPASLVFTPFFAWSEGIYPNERERRMLVKFDLAYVLSLCWLTLKQLVLNWRFGIRLSLNPMRLMMAPSRSLNIVPVFPEIQPRASRFPADTFKFVGMCVSDAVRVEPILDERLRATLELFDTSSSHTANNNNNNYKLIYASLGTIFNNNVHIYEHIINAVRTFDHVESSADNNNLSSSSSSRSLRADQLKLIVSVGHEAYKTYARRMERGEYSLPDNVIMLASAPQIQILQRAALFITHCGMNSTSEAIYHAVPIIGIPLSVDQPMVAERVCDELGIGIRLDHTTLDHGTLRRAMHCILDTSTYVERVRELAHISRQYNGNTLSAKYVNEFIAKSQLV